MSSAKNQNNTVTTLVVGATGATGKHVVQMLLNQQQHVKVIARSKSKMMSLLQHDNDKQHKDRLEITEASILDLSESDLKSLVEGCDAVVSCLGHTLDFQGIFGKQNRRLVLDATKRLTNAIQKYNPTAKYILMGSDGVSHPDGKTDDKRSLMERCILSLLRNLITPHADNEEAAAYLYGNRNVEWSVVRPTDLIDEEVSEYDIFDKPQGSLFGSGTATRANVAHFMVSLVMNGEKWNKYKYEMPVIYDKIKGGVKN